LLGYAGDEFVTLSVVTQLTSLDTTHYQCITTDQTLAPLPALIDLDDAATKTVRTQIVFAD
jgi:hypothetical protein